jgi:hypothetical protein
VLAIDIFVRIEATWNEFSDRINELINNLSELEDTICDCSFSAELSKISFVTPLSLLPLVVYAYDNNIEINYTEKKKRDNIINYLNIIGFPKGVSNLNNTNRSYLPITYFPPVGENTGLYEYEERMLSQVNMHQRFASFKQNLKFLTHELVNNVNEHSKADKYWLLAQYYKSGQNSCEIVIADCGIGYKKSYMGTNYEVDTDAKAIINALEGKSSKIWNERGRGIPSIANLFVNGFGGNLIIMSGQSIILYTPNKDRVEIPLKSYWNGSLVCLNFNLKDVNLYSYIDF